MAALDQTALNWFDLYADLSNYRFHSIRRFPAQEIKRRTQKVRIFPDEQSLERLVSAVLVKIDDKWASAEKAYIKWECQDD